MKRMLVLAAAGLAVSVSVVLTAVAADGKTPTIKEVMGALHKGKTAPLAALKTELKADPTNWENVEKSTHKYAELSVALGKNDPPKGEKGSWEKLTNTFAANSKALDDAAKAKDKAAAEAAFGKLSASCKSCHAAHKGQ